MCESARAARGPPSSPSSSSSTRRDGEGGSGGGRPRRVPVHHVRRHGSRRLGKGRKDRAQGENDHHEGASRHGRLLGRRILRFKRRIDPPGFTPADASWRSGNRSPDDDAPTPIPRAVQGGRLPAPHRRRRDLCLRHPAQGAVHDLARHDPCRPQRPRPGPDQRRGRGAGGGLSLPPITGETQAGNLEAAVAMRDIVLGRAPWPSRVSAARSLPSCSPIPAPWPPSTRPCTTSWARWPACLSIASLGGTGLPSGPTSPPTWGNREDGAEGCGLRAPRVRYDQGQGRPGPEIDLRRLEASARPSARSARSGSTPTRVDPRCGRSKL